MKRILIVTLLPVSLVATIHAIANHTCNKALAENTNAMLSEIFPAKPKLKRLTEQTFNRFTKISPIEIKNTGGHELIKCDAINFPRGLYVQVALDQKTCVIKGTPENIQTRRESIVIASNKTGSSRAVIPITVNAVVLE